MAETHKLICIICPNSCELTVKFKGKKIKEVTGNICEKGIDYARKELTNPERGVTSTVVVLGGDLPLVSVKTSQEIPKGKIFEIMDEIASVEIKAPVKIGDLILKNVAGTGADIVATKNIMKK